MKSLVSIILLSIFFMIGCQDDNSILEPTNNLSTASPQNKGRIILPKFISLPGEDTDGSLAKFVDGVGWTTTNLVTSSNDTELVVKEKYEGGIHGKVQIEVKIKVLKGSIYEDDYMTMTVNENNGTVAISSSQYLNKDAELSIKFVGLNLEDETSEDISFGFLADDGFIEQGNFKEVKFDRASGTLELVEGRISNITEYGFTTTK